jgi:hypothetical protein
MPAPVSPSQTEGFGESAALFLMVALGGALAALIVFADFAFWWLAQLDGVPLTSNPFLEDHATLRFIGQPQTLLWLFAVCLQMGFWLAIQLPAWKMMSELEGPSGRWRGRHLAGRLVLWSLVVAGVITAGLLSQRTYPLPGHGIKMSFITFIGFLAMLPAVAVVTRVHLRASTILDWPRNDDGWIDELSSISERRSNPVAGFLRLRELLDNALLILGTVVGAAILSSGALRNAVLAREGASASDFPIELVLVYGLFFTGLLAIVYVPTYLRVQALGRSMVDRFVPVADPGAAQWMEDNDKRLALESRLRLDTTLTSSFQAGAAILAPLASALVSTLLSSD